MNRKEIVDYVLHTPCNTNPNQLDDMLKEVTSNCYMQKLDNYLYEAFYSDIDYKNAYNYFSEGIEIPSGCSSIRDGNKMGRNFDVEYNENVEFVVHVPARGKKHASVGVANTLSTGITEEFIAQHPFSEAYSVLPFRIVDGINDAGLTVSINVVPTEKGHNIMTTPHITLKNTVNTRMLPRFILDNFEGAEEAANYIRDYCAITFPIDLHIMGYDIHLMVNDLEATYLIEFVENDTVVIDITEKPYMTNFYLDGVTFDDDGKVIINQDDSHINESGVTLHGAGLERYNLIVDGLANEDNLEDILESIKYTNTYTLEDNIWYTEYVDLSSTLDITSPPEDYDLVIEATRAFYEDRSRDPDSPYYGTWQTAHTSIYDMEDLTLTLYIQEDYDTSYQFKLTPAKKMIF